MKSHSKTHPTWWVRDLLCLTVLSPRLIGSTSLASALSSPATQVELACPPLPPPTGNVLIKLTGGVDAYQARGRTIRDNEIEGFWCPAGLAEHGIYMWRGCRDTTIERNVLNNAPGMGLGLATTGSGRTYADDPNTGYTTNAARTFSAVEWRYPNTEADIINNLVNDSILARDGATAIWRLSYTGGPGLGSPIAIADNAARVYTLGGLQNYTWYTLTLNGMVDGAPPLTDTLLAMPTGWCICP